MLGELGLINYIIIAICAFMVGVSKTGIPGVGILVVPLLASAVPAKASVGLLLPMLIFADIFAVAYYRRHAVWIHLIRLIPWAACGVVVGYFILGKVNNEQLKPIIGAIILVLLILNYWWNKNRDQTKVPDNIFFAGFMGLLAGILTMLANAAGPIMIIYLLAMRLPKYEFIGTRAWYFIIMNCFKVPFSANLGLINPASLRLDLVMFPVIAIGALIGIFILNRIPQKVFNLIVQVLAACAAIKLLF